LGREGLSERKTKLTTKDTLAPKDHPCILIGLQKKRRNENETRKEKISWLIGGKGRIRKGESGWGGFR